MSASKRPSTSSLRRYLTSRPYIAVADIRRRFGLDPDAMSVVRRDATTAYVGLPEREAAKLEELWQRDEVGVELSVEVHAPVLIGVYPIRIARFVIDQQTGNASANGNGYAAANGSRYANGTATGTPHLNANGVANGLAGGPNHRPVGDETSAGEPLER